MGSFLCPETTDVAQVCTDKKHLSKKSEQQCANENCMERPKVCGQCGFLATDFPDKFVCKMCSLTLGADAEDSDGGADDPTRKSSNPKMKMEYSASRDPNKL